MASPSTQRWFSRLPQYLQDVDDGTLLSFMSLLGDQLDEIVTKIDAMSFTPLDDGGDVGDTSALVDATQAGALGDPVAQLRWLAQLLGVRLNTADTLDAQIDAVRYASSGWRAGTKGALADAARSVLTGTKYVLIEDHYAGDPWAINIRTRASETPGDGSVVNAILAKHAKPAGVVILNDYFSATWTDLETYRPTWNDWSATWTEIEETNAPSPDGGNIPPPTQGQTSGFVPAAMLYSTPGNLTPDVASDTPLRIYYSKPLGDWTEVGFGMTYSDGTDILTLTLDYHELNNQVWLEFTNISGWTPGETVIATISNNDVSPAGKHIGFGADPDIISFTIAPALVNPQVDGIVPASGSSTLLSTEPISVRFNLGLDLTTVNSTNFVLTQLATGSVVSTSFSGGTGPSNPVVITPSSLTPGTEYKLQIRGTTGDYFVSDFGETFGGTYAAGVKSAGGAYMLEDFVATFTTSGAPPVILPPDPPIVISTTPANSSSAIATTAPIVVQFSRSMDPATLTSSSVVLSEVGGAVVAATLNYDTSGNRLIVTPTTALKNSKQYQLQLKTAILDTFGLHLTPSVAVTWTTVAAVVVTPDQPAPLGNGWTQTYFNHFTTALDFTNDWWRPYDGSKTTFNASWRASQVQVDTSGIGKLRLIGIRDASKKVSGATGDLISGGIALGKRPLAVKSFFEARVRCDKGDGFSPEFLTWPQSNKWPQDGENDILEGPKGDRKTNYSTYHYWDGSHKQIGKGYQSIIAGFDSSIWHVYKLEWFANRLTYSVDGIKILEITDTAIIEIGSSHHAVFQLDPAGSPGWITPWDSTTPAQVVQEIDWIRQGIYTL